LKRFDQALPCYDRALAVKRDFAEALMNRGRALCELGRVEEALTDYDRALAIRPDYGASVLQSRLDALRARGASTKLLPITTAP
jgi:tetratricopeptide (TPR) repeat protein